MVAVDLVPNELKIALHRRKRLWIWSIAVLVTLCVAGIWSGLKYAACLRQEKKLQTVTTENLDIQNNIQSLAQAENQLEKWQDRIETMKDLSGYPDYKRIMSHMAMHSPELIYLEQMQFTAPDDNSAARPAHTTMPALPPSAKMFNINSNAPSSPTTEIGPIRSSIVMLLDGKAVEHEAVANYLTMLRSSGFFIDVQLKQSRRVVSGDTETITFQLECFLASTAANGLNYADTQKPKNL